MSRLPLSAMLRSGARRRLGLIGAVAGLGLLTACGGLDRQYTPGQTDFRAAYPIRVELKTFAMSVPINAVLEGDQRLPADFINAYRRRGRGEMTIVLPHAAGHDGLRAAEAMGSWLDRQLIAAVAVRSAPGVPGADVADGMALTVFFRGHVALVSECGDWSGETGFNPSNRPHTNFGCAYQRNIGMMLADPGDLIDPRDMGPAGGARAATIIGKWTAGEYPGAELPPNEMGNVSDVIAAE